MRRILTAASNLKHVMLATTYAAGLRVNELVHIKVTDIDSVRMTIRVQQGKGAWICQHRSELGQGADFTQT